MKRGGLCSPHTVIQSSLLSKWGRCRKIVFVLTWSKKTGKSKWLFCYSMFPSTAPCSEYSEYFPGWWRRMSATLRVAAPAQAQCSPARCCGVTLHTLVQMLIKWNPLTLSGGNLFKIWRQTETWLLFIDNKIDWMKNLKIFIYLLIDVYEQIWCVFEDDLCVLLCNHNLDMEMLNLCE